MLLLGWRQHGEQLGRRWAAVSPHDVQLSCPIVIRLIEPRGDMRLHRLRVANHVSKAISHHQHDLTYVVGMLRPIGGSKLTKLRCYEASMEHSYNIVESDETCFNRRRQRAAVRWQRLRLRPLQYGLGSNWLALGGRHRSQTIACCFSPRHAACGISEERFFAVCCREVAPCRKDSCWSPHSISLRLHCQCALVGHSDWR